MLEVRGWSYVLEARRCEALLERATLRRPRLRVEAYHGEADACCYAYNAACSFGRCCSASIRRRVPRHQATSYVCCKEAEEPVRQFYMGLRSHLWALPAASLQQRHHSEHHSCFNATTTATSTALATEGEASFG